MKKKKKLYTYYTIIITKYYLMWTFFKYFYLFYEVRIDLRVLDHRRK